MKVEKAKIDCRGHYIAKHIRKGNGVVRPSGIAELNLTVPTMLEAAHTTPESANIKPLSSREMMVSCD